MIDKQALLRVRERFNAGARAAARTTRRLAGAVGDRLCVLRHALWKRTYRFTRLFAMGVDIYIKKRAARSAAQFSFFILMTLFPLLICVHWFIGMLNENSTTLIRTLSEFVPAAVMEYLTGYLDYVTESSSTTLLVAGIIMLITPSAAAFRALRGILCDIYNNDSAGNFLMFMLSFLISIVMLVLIYVSMLVLVTGSRVLRFLVEHFKLSSSLLGWNWLRFLVLFCVLCMALYLVYRFAPFDPLNPKDIFGGKALPGAITASVIIVAVSIIFSLFINFSTRYSLVYGSLASIIILMLWLYTCSNIIIAGGIVNRLTDQYKKVAKNWYVPKDMRTAARHARRTLQTALRSDADKHR